MKILEADKIGSATSPLKLVKTVAAINKNNSPKTGDVVVVKALSESVTYGNLELPNGRLAKLAVESLRAGRRVYCLDLPENGDLRVAGAVACETAELARLAAKVGIAP